MIEQIEYFQKGVVYRIKNKKTKRCLALCSKLNLKTIEEEDSCDQLWIIRQIKSGEYEIEQLKVGSVMTLHQSKKNYSIQMNKDRFQENQLWSIIHGETIDNNNYFWIKPALNINLSLCTSSYNEQIKLSEIQQTLSICLWEFLPYQQNSLVLNTLTTLKAETSKLVLTLPDHSSKEGVTLIQYSFNGGGHQRWLIEAYKQLKEGAAKQYLLRNYCSGLYLTAVFAKLAFKVVQSIYNCSPDQRWSLINISNNIFLLQSVTNPSYYLGVTNDKGGSQVYLLQDRLKARWIFEGCFTYS